MNIYKLKYICNYIFEFFTLRTKPTPLSECEDYDYYMVYEQKDLSF